MISDAVNKELLIGFIDESIESLSAVDGLFVKLEANPSDMDIINDIFRPIHSLKGNAAYFGHMKIKKLAHTMENILDQIRKGVRPVDKNIIDVLLPGADCLRSMLSSVRVGEPEVTDEGIFLEIVGNVDAVLQSSVHEEKNGSVAEISVILQEIQSRLSGDGLELYGKLVALLTGIPSLNQIKHAGKSKESSQDIKQDMTHAVGRLKELLISSDSIPNGSDKIDMAADLIMLVQDENSDDGSAKIVKDIQEIFEAFTQADTGLDNMAISMILEKLSLLSNEKHEHDGLVVTNAKPSNELPKEKTSLKNKHDKTMRIPEQSLDDFLRCVGELLGVEEMLRLLSRQINTGADTSVLSNGIKDAVEQFEGISKELRTKIMEVRKVEARLLLQKTPRIVRDIAAQSGKKIVVECRGEEINIDKSYIDLLDAPLTHMVRNAADHGIELPVTRVTNGKSETGKIIVTIQETANDLQLIIQDDGAGLNFEGIQKKAIELGIIATNAKVTRDDVVELLFQSGVSTAEVVTDVSGRGVGMDVVKRAIIEAGGTIDVSSNPNSGTTFTVSVPRNASTQIFDGYMVRSFSGEMYVLPLAMVTEAFSIKQEEISGVAGKGRVLTRRGTVFPLHDLDTLLGTTVCEGSDKNEQEKMGVVIEFKGKKTVLVVKEIIGIQKIVSKQVEGTVLDNELFDGAAISGTGHVSLIVNIEKLLNLK